MNILNYINKKGYNIFESIQLLYDMDMYGSMDNIFKELKDIIPDTIQINTEGISDEKILFLLNNINGCFLNLVHGLHIICFIKNNVDLFYWNLKNDKFWITYSKIWKVFEVKYDMNDQEIQYIIKNVLEQYCKIKGVEPNW